ncbi:AAA family ATPase [Mycolicibacillus trivialis]|uniref:AAA family ATPase n=1 Tax=Mycolicibacillus trivialis TaxID=1798 RepID=UPI0010544F0B|nr:ATP-binding protein [Mycolicibacillus trivialis]
MQIQRFKSIEDLVIEPGEVTVLVGPNNSGKSSALQALQFAVSVCQSLESNSSRGTPRKDGAYSGTLGYDQLLYTPLKDVLKLGRHGELTQNADTAISICLEVDGAAADVTVRRGRNKNIAVSVSTAPELWQALSSTKDLFSIIAPGLAGIPAHEEYKNPGVIRRAAARGDANNILRNVLLFLRRNDSAWQTFVDRMRSVFPHLEIAVDFNANNDEFIAADATFISSQLPLDSIGTGTLQAVQIFAYIGAFNPRVLILDEPDSHLHPNNQRLLARELSNISKATNLQILLATHSRHILDEFQMLDADLFFVSESATVATDFDMTRTLIDLGALDQVDRLRNGAVKMLVLSEDSNTAAIQAMIHASNWNRDEYLIYSYHGCSKLDSAKLLAEFVSGCAPNTSLVIHRDRDSLSEEDAKTWSAEVRAVGAYPFITPGVDTESTFLNADHISAISSLSVEDSNTLLDQAVLDVREESVSKLSNERTQRAAQQKRQGEYVSTSAYAHVRQAESDFDADPRRYCLGKKALKRFKQIYHQQTGENINPIAPSPALATDLFVQLRQAS